VKTLQLRRVLVLAATSAALAIAPAGIAGAAGPAGGACQLVGVANLSPGLSSTSHNFTYNFTGNLSGCQSNVAGAPATGTVSAGVTLPETVTLTNTSTGATQQGTVSYQEPIPTGSGTCGNSTTAGQSLATWADNTKTVVSYTTTGALSAVSLSGNVAASMTLSLVASSVPSGFSAPATFTINTTRFTTADTSSGALTFTPTTQAQDCVTTPVSSANINGAIGIGSTG
jgi:hypothetical protein